MHLDRQREKTGSSKLKNFYIFTLLYSVSAMIWIFVSLPNYVETLMLKIMVLGGETFVRCLGHEGRAFVNEISAFVTTGPNEFACPEPYKDTARSL